MELSKVYSMMSGIKPGDKISFDSYGACDSAVQLGRSGSATIPAVGTAERVYFHYVIVRLRKARECVHWGSIRKVNSIDWPIWNKGKA